MITAPLLRTYERSIVEVSGTPTGGCDLSAIEVVEKETLKAELAAEHRRLDEQLQVLERRRALTPAEQVEMSRLKKQKLLTKDRLARLG